MNFSRPTKRRTLLLWSVLLILSLLGSQGTALHVHSLDNDHDDRQSHAQLGQAHSAYDFSHSEHLSGVIDVSPDGALKNISSTLLTSILIAFPFLLLVITSSKQVFYQSRKNKLILYEPHLLSPPLRAPPK